MHSAKISDQKITKISKHRNDCAGGSGRGRADGASPGNSRLPRDPFFFPREALLNLLITWEAPSQGNPPHHHTHTHRSSRTLRFPMVPAREAVLPEVGALGGCEGWGSLPRS